MNDEDFLQPNSAIECLRKVILAFSLNAMSDKAFLQPNCAVQ